MTQHIQNILHDKEHFHIIKMHQFFSMLIFQNEYFQSIVRQASLNFHEEKLWKIVELFPFLLGSKWMCKFCTKPRSVIKEDHVYLYECCLLFNGLKDLAYRDMVRENDGIGMLETWKLDMPQFWQNHHNKYLIIGHKLLSGTKQLLTLLVQFVLVAPIQY